MAFKIALAVLVQAKKFFVIYTCRWSWYDGFHHWAQLRKWQLWTMVLFIDKLAHLIWYFIDYSWIVLYVNLHALLLVISRTKGSWWILPRRPYDGRKRQFTAEIQKSRVSQQRKACNYWTLDTRSYPPLFHYFRDNWQSCLDWSSRSRVY